MLRSLKWLLQWPLSLNMKINLLQLLHKFMKRFLHCFPLQSTLNLLGKQLFLWENNLKLKFQMDCLMNPTIWVNLRPKMVVKMFSCRSFNMVEWKNPERLMNKRIFTGIWHVKLSGLWSEKISDLWWKNFASRKEFATLKCLLTSWVKLRTLLVWLFWESIGWLKHRKKTTPRKIAEQEFSEDLRSGFWKNEPLGIFSRAIWKTKKNIFAIRITLCCTT
jgi:hypothetical protein